MDPILFTEEQLQPLPINVGMSIARAERVLIEATLAAHGGNKAKAAAVLDISVKTLYSRLQVYEAEDRGMRALPQGGA